MQKELTLTQLSGDTIQDKKFQTLIELWKFYEYRKQLNAKSVIEASWLKPIEKSIVTVINKPLKDIEAEILNSNHELTLLY